MNPFRGLQLPALALLLCASCKAFNAPFGWGEGPKLHSPDEVPAAIEEARIDFEAGRTAEALEHVRLAREVRGLSADQKVELDLLIERYAERRINELAAEDADAEELADMVSLGLPSQLAVAAGMQAARIDLAEGSPFDAYKELKKVETKYPRHHGKSEASAILIEAGLQLADNPWSFLGFFAKRDKGIEVLEYLVLTYPSEPRCDEAYAKLADLYEEDQLWSLARERHEDLLLYHPASPLAVRSEARIPHLRLAGLKSPEYDRRELLKARVELEAWLERHANHELEDEVRLDYGDCLHRIVVNDLAIASFYRRVDKPYGARLHAQRAVETARLTGDEDLIERADGMLSSLPEVGELPVSPPRPAPATSPTE